MTLLLVASVGGGLAAFKHNYDVTHDLSVIGKGKPTVVQIHDPGCQLAQRPRKNADVAIARLDGELLYRIADIETPAGFALQRRHEMPQVTLLLFDDEGQLCNVLRGVKDDDIQTRAFEKRLER